MAHNLPFRRSRRKNRGGGGPAEPPKPSKGHESESENDDPAEPDLPDPQDIDAPLPRGKRRRRRAKEDRGLPPDNELVALATAFLQTQRRLWPKVVEAGLLSEPTEKVVAQMVTDFKHRHRTGKVDLEQVQSFALIVPKLAGNYDRYSCDNSSPTSILDQMVKSLEKAHAENRLIVWSYVFADYSTSGLDPSRQGYGSLKMVLSDPKHLIETIYIDDFTRAGRAEIEWWRLAALVKRCRKRLIGASDGFDLSNENSEMLITMFGLLSRLFIKGLREKVRRGMRGGARRGTVLGKLPLGFTRKVKRDKDGSIVYRPDGLPRHEICIDPSTQKFRVLMFELFSVKKWSPYQIAKHFNDLKIDDWDGWTESGIKKMLVGLDAMGVFIWNRTRREYDPDQDKIVVLENPRSEWERYINRDLRLVPVEWWTDARRRLRKVWDKSQRVPRPSRNQVSSVTLFSNAMDCEYCEAEIKLLRSTGKYKQMGCLNGMQHAHDCKLSSSKSVKVIEECLLAFIRANLFSEVVVRNLLQKANLFFEQEAQKPQVDTAPMKAEVRKLIANIRKYQRFIEEEPDETLCRSHNARVKELQARLNVVQEKLREAERQNRKPPKPLEVDRSQVFVPDLRELLNQEIPMAAEAIRTLCGRIKIRQEEVPGRPGARWIATFSPDVVTLLRSVARDKGYADAAALAAAPSDAQPVEVVIDKIPKYELLAPVFLQMEQSGTSVQTIASAHKMSWQYAKDILDFAKTGKRPEWKSGKGGSKGQARPAKYPDLKERVAELRDVKKMPFPAIAAQLKVGIGTVYRAYDSDHHDEVCAAAERGEKPDRGRSTRLGADKYHQIRTLIGEGERDADVANVVGCGQSTVARTRRAMKAEADGEQTA